MIRVYVDLHYVHGISQLFAGDEDPALEEALCALSNSSLVPTDGDWQSISIGAVLEESYRRLTDMRDPGVGMLFDNIQNAIQDCAEAYHVAGISLLPKGEKPICSFCCHAADARKAVALHELAPHGVLIDRSARSIRKEPVVFPDLLFGVRLLALPIPRNRHAGSFLAAVNCLVPPVPFLSQLECQLCDNVSDAVARILALPKKIRRWISKRRTNHEWDASNTILKMIEVWIEESKLAKGSGDVCVFPQLFCCPAIRISREEGVSLPLIGNHHFLSSAMLRQGLGKRFSSGIWPTAIWRKFNDPINTVLLQAAETAAGIVCRPLHPTIPTRSIAKQLQEAVWDAERDADYIESAYESDEEVDEDDADDSTQDCQIEQEDEPETSENTSVIVVGFDIDRYVRPLKQLGLYSTLDHHMVEDGLIVNEATRRCFEAINEYYSLLYSDDPQESLHIQNVLDLYPLHKRVMGLVEYIVVPRLKRRGVKGDATSALWTNAFTGWKDAAGVSHSGLSRASLPSGADRLATLETEGNWLLYAAEHEAAGRTGPIDLSALLDGLVACISSASEVGGISVNLQPPTPEAHARQLATLAELSNPNSACMALYLGKIALLLRNAVEHGADRVVKDGLLMDTAHYWVQTRGRKMILDWLRSTATQVAWRLGSSFPATLPSAANTFLLTRASLQRCLVLLSLILHAGFHHFGIQR